MTRSLFYPRENMTTYDIKPLTEKTITMSAEHADKWLTALRSGKYQQCKGKMNHKGGYCCLGVLQKVVDGKVEDSGFPSISWLNDHNIQFKTHNISYVTTPDIGFLNNPNLSGLISASQANDYYDRSFNEIADLLEHCIEKT